MKLWIDDVREAPAGYIWCKSVNEAIDTISKNGVEELNLDHDAGDFSSQGGDYIKILDWLEENDPNNKILFHIHSMNPVGVENMRRIIWKNGWREI